MLGELIKPLIESAQRGDVLLLAAVLFVVAISNFSRIDRFLMDRKKVRLKGIEEALPACSARLVQKEMKRQIEDQEVNDGTASPA